jgi:hypothetical protein
VFESLTDCGEPKVDGVGENNGGGADGRMMEYVAKATLLCGIPGAVAIAPIFVVAEMESGAE